MMIRPALLRNEVGYHVETGLKGTLRKPRVDGLRCGDSTFVWQHFIVPNPKNLMARRRWQPNRRADHRRRTFGATGGPAMRGGAFRALIPRKGTAP
jgi:hypothetical protein